LFIRRRDVKELAAPLSGEEATALAGEIASPFGLAIDSFQEQAHLSPEGLT
jgi:hypothetical protein